MTDPAPPPGQGQDTARTPTVTVAEAAQRLGLTTDAVRRRLHRGTLAGAKDEHGVWRVFWPDEDAPPGERPDTPGERPESARALIAHLEVEVTYLREQLDRALRQMESERERFDVIHREALGRIEALTAGETVQHAAQSTQDGPHEEQGGDMDSEASASWWRRWWRSLMEGPQ